MRKIISRSSRKAGMPPGSLVHLGERRVEQPEITIADYDAEHLTEHVARTVDECRPYRDTPSVTWIDLSGLHDVELVRQLGECYGIHPLVMEDILNTQQRPKLEEFDQYLFTVVKYLRLDPGSGTVVAEQISLIVGPNLVISVRETAGDLFDSVRARIRNERGRVRAAGPDYLAYCLLDVVVDGYYGLLESLSEQIEEVEDDLVGDPSREILHRVHSLKRELIFVRKSVWPLREVLAVMHRADARLIRQSTAIYLRDVYDHTIQIVDTIESLRDIVSGLHDLYLSSVSNRLNEVMKVLTMWATIFIPLTFVAGVYGMNFRHMPELDWRWGYFGALVVMAGIAAGMVGYFRRKGWL